MKNWQGDHGFDDDVAARVTSAFPPYLIASQSTTIVPFSATNHDSIDHTNQMLSRIKLLTTSSTSQTVSRPDQDQYFDPDEEISMNLTQVLPSQQGIGTFAFADVLTLHLSRYARQQMFMGIIPTDEMFQRESRRVLYHDGDDEWNQTVADNPDWLKAFRSDVIERSDAHKMPPL